MQKITNKKTVMRWNILICVIDLWVSINILKTTERLFSLPQVFNVFGVQKKTFAKWPNLIHTPAFCIHSFLTLSKVRN